MLTMRPSCSAARCWIEIGPLANSLFHHRPDANFQPDSKLEAAVHKADNSIRKVIELLEAT
jgi:hypothetical protein